MGTTSQSNTWLIGGGLAALASIISLLFTDNLIMAGALGGMAVVFIVTGLTSGRSDAGRRNDTA